MCEGYLCARTILCLYVIALWGLFSVIFNLCNRLQDISRCLYDNTDVPCAECFSYDYSWYNVAVGLATVYSIHVFIFTVICIYVYYKRYRNWRYGIFNSQLYSPMTA